MSRQEIFDKLKKLLKLANSSSPELVEQCDENSDLRSDLGLTSIGVLYLAISIEQEFGIEFEGSSFDEFSKVKDVIDYIEQSFK